MRIASVVGIESTVGGRPGGSSGSLGMKSNESQRLIVGRAGGSGGSWRMKVNALQRMNEGRDGFIRNEVERIVEEY
jgi:hypothetical protein